MGKNYWSIILSSDLHFGYLDYLKDVGIRLDKIDHVHKIIQMKDEYNVQMVITAGDLTENGLDGRSILCWRKNTHDELTPMIDKWVTPLENAGIDVLLTIGNHDTYTGQPYVYKPVFEYIKKNIMQRVIHSYIWNIPVVIHKKQTIFYLFHWEYTLKI